MDSSVTHYHLALPRMSLNNNTVVISEAFRQVVVAKKAIVARLKTMLEEIGQKEDEVMAGIKASRIATERATGMAKLSLLMDSRFGAEAQLESAEREVAQAEKAAEDEEERLRRELAAQKLQVPLDQKLIGVKGESRRSRKPAPKAGSMKSREVIDLVSGFLFERI